MYNDLLNRALVLCLVDFWAYHPFDIAQDRSEPKAKGDLSIARGTQCHEEVLHEACPEERRVQHDNGTKVWLTKHLCIDKHIFAIITRSGAWPGVPGEVE
jgi:hypothetical protein